MSGLRLATALALALGAICLVSSAASAAELIFYWGTDEHLSQLGPVPLDPVTKVSARKLIKGFGKPSKKRRIFGNTTCEISWKQDGLKVWVTTFDGARKNVCKRGGVPLQRAWISGRAGKQWHPQFTSLHIGDSFETLQQLYPYTAEFTTTAGKAWSLSNAYYSPITGGNTADITARVKQDKVAAFEIWVGGGGE